MTIMRKIKIKITVMIIMTVIIEIVYTNNNRQTSVKKQKHSGRKTTITGT